MASCSRSEKSSRRRCRRAFLKRLVKLLHQRKQAGKRAERSGKIVADGLGVAIERIQRITQQPQRRFTQRRCALLRVQILRLADDRKAAQSPAWPQYRPHSKWT